MVVSFIGGGSWKKPLTSRNLLKTGLELATLVVIGTDCTGSCKSNYHMITTATPPKIKLGKHYWPCGLLHLCVY
jgi:hypothetical protein